MSILKGGVYCRSPNRKFTIQEMSQNGVMGTFSQAFFEKQDDFRGELENLESVNQQLVLCFEKPHKMCIHLDPDGIQRTKMDYCQALQCPYAAVETVVYKGTKKR